MIFFDTAHFFDLEVCSARGRGGGHSYAWCHTHRKSFGFFLLARRNFAPKLTNFGQKFKRKHRPFFGTIISTSYEHVSKVPMHSWISAGPMYALRGLSVDQYRTHAVFLTQLFAMWTWSKPEPRRSRLYRTLRSAAVPQGISALTGKPWRAWRLALIDATRPAAARVISRI